MPSWYSYTQITHNLRNHDIRDEFAGSQLVLLNSLLTLSVTMAVGMTTVRASWSPTNNQLTIFVTMISDRVAGVMKNSYSQSVYSYDGMKTLVSSFAGPPPGPAKKYYK